MKTIVMEKGVVVDVQEHNSEPKEIVSSPFAEPIVLLAEIPREASSRPRRTRIRPDVYHSLEEYRGFSLRYCWDPVWTNTIRVYVEHHPEPNYAGNDTRPSVTHLWPRDGGAPPYLCFKREYAPTTLEGARELAQKWCDLTLRYISTGQTISEQIESAA